MVMVSTAWALDECLREGRAACATWSLTGQRLAIK